MLNWLKALGIAIAGGALGAVTPTIGNWATAVAAGSPAAPVNLHTVGTTAVAGAVIGFLGMLLKNPLSSKGTQ